MIALQLLAGTFVLMYSTMLFYRAVGRGHYRALVWVLTPLTLVIGLVWGNPVGLLSVVTAAAMGVFLAAVYTQRPLLEWLAGGVSSGLAVSSLVASGWSQCESGCATAIFHALSGAFFLGAVTHGMVLGHWYLNQPRLPIEPLKAQVRLIMASVIVSLATVLLTISRLLTGEIKGVVLPISSSGYLWGWGLLLATVAIFSFMIRSTVASRSTQSATGLMYVAMIPAIGAQFVVNLLLMS